MPCARSISEARPVADFYDAVTAMLDDLGVGTTIWPMPDRTEHTTMAESYEIDGVPLAPSHP